MDMDPMKSLGMSMSTGSFTDEIKKDMNAFRIHFFILIHQISQLRKRVLRVFTEPPSAEAETESQHQPLLHISVDGADGHLSSSLARRHQDPDTTTPQSSPPSTRTPSPPLSPSSDEEDILMRALDEHNTVQITTRTGSTDTLHMNVEVNGTAPGAPVFTSSFSASPRPAIVETVEVEKVTSKLCYISYTLSKQKNSFSHTPSQPPAPKQR